MPPLPQKGTGKKGREARPSRSRNSTPSLITANANSSLSTSESSESALLELPLRLFPTSDDISDVGTAIPSLRDLVTLSEKLQRLVDSIEMRGTTCDRGMRRLSQIRKNRQDEIDLERIEEERKERQKRDAANEEERGRHKANKVKKRKEKEISTSREERPLTHGAHGLAPQDGSKLERSSPMPAVRKAPRRLSGDNDSASSSLSPVAVATPTATGMDLDEKDDNSSSDEHQPPLAPAVPYLQTFGDDPLSFPDPTVYDIRNVTDDMDEDTKKEIFSVATYPPSNLEDLIPGSPPDKDFSNAKPTNQVQANTFAGYIEPFFRAYTEEDLAFLRERGDRTTPMFLPRRGIQHYSEKWAMEDNGGMVMDGPGYGLHKRSPNQARGDFEYLDDNAAETDAISTGPVLTRLLATLRPEHRAPASEEKPTMNGFTNSEASINGDANGDLGDLTLPGDASAPLPAATFMTESSSESWKKATHPKLDYSQIDERIKQELRHIGLLPPEDNTAFDDHEDDEIAVRLRSLQAELRQQSIMNGARKARLQELVKERMAHQEYTTILEDLDGQTQAAYLKRTRTMGKSKKQKRPGGAGGGSHFVAGTNGMAKPGIGDQVKTIMERRKRWIESVGPVFDDERSTVKVPRAKNPGSSMLKPEDMAEYIKKEKERWDEEAEDE
ncbi:putative chromatin-remodeling complexes subunit NGG1 [Amylocarpus encephaloides]|uniref:Chromatin-remodeling complexes subunit NGG1 n=1 Tax=Amylocarpus encephaloides TaxID=45428 RepID=A0A9P7YMU7_9HELO|nr:putative chromatin-remodeling complexes subunit NGG1 [Amylocarpus encephaloides]